MPTEEQLKTVPDVETPVVRTHPVTKRKGLFINEAHTSALVGLSKAEAMRCSRSSINTSSSPNSFTPITGRRRSAPVGNCAVQHKANLITICRCAGLCTAPRSEARQHLKKRRAIAGETNIKRSLILCRHPISRCSTKQHSTTTCRAALMHRRPCAAACRLKGELPFMAEAQGLVTVWLHVPRSAKRSSTPGTTSSTLKDVALPAW